VLINRSILAYGNTSDVFTPENIARAFDNSLGDLANVRNQLNLTDRELR
jgi:ABC-type Mn2+/Zn2+ transport system ATPase subunit